MRPRRWPWKVAVALCVCWVPVSRLALGRQWTVNETLDGLIKDSIHLMDGGHQTLCVSRHLPASLKQSDPHWSLDQFELLDELYKGKISLLHKAVHKASGHYVAIKQYKKKLLSPLNRYQVEREIQIHINLLHRHIIRLHAAFEDPEQVYLVQEFAPGGDLFEVLKHQPSMTFTETEAVVRYLVPCLKALAYLQDKGYLAGHHPPYIKPENILIGEGGDVKLADFGLAINVDKERPVTRAGTLDYMAPEVLVCPDKKRPDENKDKASFGYNKQVDAWALGCLAAELVTGSPPFEADSKSATYQLIMYREPRLASLLSQAARSFIAASLAKSPSERFTIEQLLQHEWITSKRSAQTGTDKVAAAVVTCCGTMSEPYSIKLANPLAISRQQGCASNGKCSRSSTEAEANSTMSLVLQHHSKEQDMPNSSIPPPALDTSQQQASMSILPASVWVGISESSAHETAMKLHTAAAAATSKDCIVLGDAASAGKLQNNGEHATAADNCALNTCKVTLTCVPAGVAPATAAPEVPLLLTQVHQAASSTEPRCLLTCENGIYEAAAAAEAVQGICGTASGAARQVRCRPSSTHGHGLDLIYYAHDKHRRPSYSNVPWDDFIDTSSQSFASCANFAATDLGGTDGSSTAVEYQGRMLRAAYSSSRVEPRAMTSHSQGDDQPISYHHADDMAPQIMTAAIVDGVESRHGLGLSAANSNSSCQVLGRIAPEQLLLLAALPGAELQAPAAVVHKVMAKTASGALHLLAANDLEDLIAPTVAPGIALSTLGLTMPAAADMAVNTSSGSFGNHIDGRISAGGERCDHNSIAAAATDKILNGDNLDDFIALSAAPSGQSQHSFIIPSRIGSSSVPDSLALLASSSASPVASPLQAAVPAATPHSSGSPVTSPRSSHLRHASVVGPDPVGCQHCFVPHPLAASTSRGSSSNIRAAPPAVAAAYDGGGDATAAAPMRRVKSGILLSTLAQGQIGGGCTATSSRGAAGEEGLSRTASTPNGSKRVIWTCDTPILSPRSAIVRTAGTTSTCSVHVQDDTVSSCRAGRLSFAHQQAAVAEMRQPPVLSQQQPSCCVVQPAVVPPHGLAPVNQILLNGNTSTIRQSALAGHLDLTPADYYPVNLSAATCSLQQQQQQQPITFIRVKHAASSTVDGRSCVASSKSGLLSCAPTGVIGSDKQKAGRRSSSDGSTMTTRGDSSHNGVMSKVGGVASTASKKPVPMNVLSGVMGLPNSSLKLPALASSLNSSSGRQCVGDGHRTGMTDLLHVQTESRSVAADTAGDAAAGVGRCTGALTPTKQTYPTSTVNASTNVALARSKSHPTVANQAQTICLQP